MNGIELGNEMDRENRQDPGFSITRRSWVSVRQHLLCLYDGASDVSLLRVASQLEAGWERGCKGSSRHDQCSLLITYNIPYAFTAVISTAHSGLKARACGAGSVCFGRIDPLDSAPTPGQSRQNFKENGRHMWWAICNATSPSSGDLHRAQDQPVISCQPSSQTIVDVPDMDHVGFTMCDKGGSRLSAGGARHGNPHNTTRDGSERQPAIHPSNWRGPMKGRLPACVCLFLGVLVPRPSASAKVLLFAHHRPSRSVDI